MRPALSSIKIFTTVAGLGSFTQAASVLHVTQGAVSQQVAKLEEMLGEPLFVRGGRGLTLTDAGRRLYGGVSASVERIEAEIDAVLTHREDRVLAITTMGSFAAQWLMPRLAAFEAQHPDIRLHVDTGLRLVDLRGEGIELGVRGGSGDWPGLHTELLFRQRIFPVASREFAATLPLHQGPAVLADQPLYYDMEAPTEWTRWFAKVGAPGQNMQLARGFTDTLVVLSALRNGLEGVALISEHLIERELEEGSLIRLYDEYIQGDGAHYLVYPRNLPLSESATQFRKWLLAESEQ